MSSDCALPSGLARLEAMRQRAAAAGIPLHATLALTHRCNLRCIHCYVLPNAKPPETELSTADWLALAGETVAAGCISMLLTGGEPLLRKDFAEIYLGIRKMGVHVALFTNATRVDEHVIEILQQAPPRLIEVSVYGATPETYERVTGSATAHAEAMRGIGLLRDAGLSVRLKTVLMRENRNDFTAIREMAARGDLPVRYDAMLQPRFPGDQEIQRLRVPPGEVAELEARSVSGLAAQWRKQYERRKVQTPAGPPALYACAAGAISLYVSAEGMVQPCVSAVRHGVRYERGGLLKAFHAGRDAVRSLHAPAGYECATCRDRIFCGSCPPIAELECGQEAGVCSYACALARKRSRLATFER